VTLGLSIFEDGARADPRRDQMLVYVGLAACEVLPCVSRLAVDAGPYRSTDEGAPLEALVLENCARRWARFTARTAADIGPPRYAGRVAGRALAEGLEVLRRLDSGAEGARGAVRSALRDASRLFWRRNWSGEDVARAFDGWTQELEAPPFLVRGSGPMPPFLARVIADADCDVLLTVHEAFGEAMAATLGAWWDRIRRQRADRTLCERVRYAAGQHRCVSAWDRFFRCALEQTPDYRRRLELLNWAACTLVHAYDEKWAGDSSKQPPFTHAQAVFSGIEKLLETVYASLESARETGFLAFAVGFLIELSYRCEHAQVSSPAAIPLWYNGTCQASLRQQGGTRPGLQARKSSLPNG